MIGRGPVAQDHAKPSLRERATTLRRQGWSRLRGGALTPTRGGWSVALGVFIGCIPVFGLHLPLCLAVCVPLRLDAPVAYLAANISNPLVAPWLVVAEVQAGAWIVTGSFVAFSVDAARQAGVGGFVAYAAVGAIVVGLALAGLTGGVTAAILAVRRRR